MKPDISLKTLYYFSILAEEKHFGIAAKKIGIDQPLLSLQIKTLEKKVGGLLFDRSNRRVVLTERGIALLPEVLKVLAAKQSLREKVERINRGETGVLRVGFTSCTAFCNLPALIHKHRQRYPKTDFLLKELSQKALTESLLTGAVDVGFIREPEKRDGIALLPYAKENFLAVLPNHHPLALRSSLTITELAEEPFVLFPRAEAQHLYDKVNAIFQLAGFSPKVVLEAAQMQTIINLAEAGLGITVCPASFKNYRPGAVTYVPLTDVQVQTSVFVCTPVENTSTLLPTFLNLIQAENNASRMVREEEILFHI